MSHRLAIAALALVLTLTWHGLADPVKKPPKGTDAGDKVKPVKVGPNVVFEKDGAKRRVLVTTEVCLREGELEQLLTRKHGKEHEAILAFDGDTRHIHAALLLTGAKPGSPAQYKNDKYIPAKGAKIKVTLQYKDAKGKTVTVPAQKWVRYCKSKKNLSSDWVFAGSRFVKNPLDEKKPDYYLANDGDVICVANFDGALLDLPVESSKSNEDHSFEANTDLIPAKGTKVTIILEPVPEKKTGDKKK
jgi:hypothetical protein